MAARIVPKLQLTLALIKPDITGNPLLIEEIQRLWSEQDFTVVCSKRMHLSRSEVKNFYMEHKNKFFYNRLVNFASSGPIIASILYREDAIAHWRKLMGGTKVYRTIYEAPETIRGSFGLTDTRNSTHGSDSPKSAASEIGTFFPEFSITRWYESLDLNAQTGLRDFVERT